MVNNLFTLEEEVIRKLQNDCPPKPHIETTFLLFKNNVVELYRSSYGIDPSDYDMVIAHFLYNYGSSASYGAYQVILKKGQLSSCLFDRKDVTIFYEHTEYSRNVGPRFVVKREDGLYSNFDTNETNASLTETWKRALEFANWLSEWESETVRNLLLTEVNNAKEKSEEYKNKPPVKDIRFRKIDRDVLTFDYMLSPNWYCGNTAIIDNSEIKSINLQFL